MLAAAASSSTAIASVVIGALAIAVPLAGTCAALLVKIGRREGKVDEILDRLVKVSERHDNEIRELWRYRR